MRVRKNRAHFVSGSKSRADLKWFHILHMDLVHLSERHFTQPEMCVSVCVCGNISLSATRVAHKFLAVQKCGDVMNFDINENTINQSGYLRREQSAAERSSMSRFSN